MDNIYLIDDHPEFGALVQELLESQGFLVRYFNTGNDFFRIWDGDPRGCILLDIQMPGMNGLEFLQRMGDATRTLPVILLTSVVDMKLAVEATKLGVFEYCPKPFLPDELFQKVKVALQFNKERLQQKASHHKTMTSLNSLSPRENQVLDLLCSGKSSKQIGRELGISPFTVDNHRARIFDKMDVSSVSQLVQTTLSARMTPLF